MKQFDKYYLYYLFYNIKFQDHKKLYLKCLLDKNQRNNVKKKIIIKYI